jgi:hypothetical protein
VIVTIETFGLDIFYTLKLFLIYKIIMDDFIKLIKDKIGLNITNFEEPQEFSYSIPIFFTEKYDIYYLPLISQLTMTYKEFKYLSSFGIFPIIIEKYMLDNSSMILLCEKILPIEKNKSLINKLLDLKIRLERLHQAGFSLDTVIPLQIYSTSDNDRVVIKPNGFLLDQFSDLYQKGVNHNIIDIDNILNRI